MKNVYALENQSETERLKQQSSLLNYNIAEDLKHLGQLNIAQSSRALDAGCGAGELAQYLVDEVKIKNVEACDFSEIRVRQAKENILSANRIKFFCANLQDLPQDLGNYDLIISRYVFQHLPEPHEALKQIYSHLNQNAYVYLIDSNGFLVNFETKNSKLKKYLDLFRKSIKEKKIPFNPYIGAELAKMAKACGFKEIKENLTKIELKDQTLQDEYQQNIIRFKFAKPMLTSMFGEAGADDFVKLYLEEMQNPKNEICYHKVIVHARK